MDVDNTPTIEDVAKFLANIKIKRKMFGGYTKVSVIDNFAKVSDMYRAIIFELSEKADEKERRASDLEKELEEVKASREELLSLSREQQEEVKEQKERYKSKYEEVIHALNEVEHAKRAVEEQARAKADAYIHEARQKVIDEKLKLHELEKKTLEAEEAYRRRKDELENLNHDYKKRLEGVLRILEPMDQEKETSPFYKLNADIDSESIS